MKGFSRNSPPKVHLNFAQNLGRQILGNTLSGLKEKIVYKYLIVFEINFMKSYISVTYKYFSGIQIPKIT